MFCVKVFPRGPENPADKMHIIKSCGLSGLFMDRGAHLYVHLVFQKDICFRNKNKGGEDTDVIMYILYYFRNTLSQNRVNNYSVFEEQALF